MNNSTVSQITVESSKCQRCEKLVGSDKGARVTFRDRNMTFCENCFKSVFKYDESLRTVFQIYDQVGKQTPFIIRSNNWHRASFMIVNSVKSVTGKNGNPKITFVGDFYLRGDLKEQGHAVGKANHFIWMPWSVEEAAKYKEETSSSKGTSGDTETTEA